MYTINMLNLIWTIVFFCVFQKKIIGIENDVRILEERCDAGIMQLQIDCFIF